MDNVLKSIGEIELHDRIHNPKLFVPLNRTHDEAELEHVRREAIDEMLRRSREAVYSSHCSCWSLGLQANGRIVRHSVSCGSVEKVGPGTRRPLLRTVICKGSGKFVGRRSLPECQTIT